MEREGICLAEPHPRAVAVRHGNSLGEEMERERESDWESPTHGLSQSGTAALLGGDGERDLTGECPP